MVDLILVGFYFIDNKLLDVFLVDINIKQLLFISINVICSIQ